LELDGLAPVEAVALATEIPEEVVAEGLPKLLERGSVEVREGFLVAPRFLEAQECIKSDKQRAREYRDRRRSQAMGEPSRNVTPESRNVASASREITTVTDHHARVTLNSADLNSALLGNAVPLKPVAAVSVAEKLGRAWYMALTERTEADMPSAAAAYEFIGKQPAEDRATVAANLRASTVHRTLKARRALSPKRIAENLWHTHLLSEQEHAEQK